MEVFHPLRRFHFPVLVLLFACLAIAASAQTVGVDKSSLAFSSQTNGSKQSQSLNITTSVGTTSFTTFVNTTWLTVNPLFGTAPSAITVNADPTGLQPGIYQGVISI